MGAAAQRCSLDTHPSFYYILGMATSLRGVKYLLDARGRRTAVQIDLRKNAALWEDILDVAVARQRASEPTESLDAVRRRLQKAGKLKRSA